MKCQSKYFGAKCNGIAKWKIKGTFITPHVCCDNCKDQWIFNKSPDGKIITEELKEEVKDVGHFGTESAN